MYSLNIIWPLVGTPPSWEEADVIYDRLNAIWDTKAMGKWMGNCLEGMQSGAVGKLQLRPYSFAHWYEEIEEDGFPGDPGDWFSPDAMIEATEKLRLLIDEENPNALALAECFIHENRTGQGLKPAYGQPAPRVREGEDPVDVEKWRAQEFSLLLRNLDGVVATARACQSEGIEQIAFCYF